jgi:predicted lipoprotein
MRRIGFGAAVLASALMLAACSGIPGVYTVEKVGDGTAAASAGANAADGAAFDAASLADKAWSEDVPKSAAAAVPIDTLFSGLASDSDGTSSKYGHNQGAGSPWSFMVSGEGTIASVDTSGASALLVVNQDYAPNARVSLQVGPALIGTAIRDSLGTIQFGQFVNQIDFADVATALNDKVKKGVVADLDPPTLAGKKVKFVGAFSLVDPSNVVITPVRLQVLP